jgi:NAD(P)-dependent dehydrogenase (short-subunit alcohol dehydrogenase family)
MNRPETIEETAALVEEAAAARSPSRWTILCPTRVQALVTRIEGEHGCLHVLVNSSWGATDDGVEQVGLGVLFGLWAAHLRLGVDTHAITSHFAIPLLIKTPGGLVVEVTDGTDEYNSANYRVSFF